MAESYSESLFYPSRMLFSWAVSLLRKRVAMGDAAHHGPPLLPRFRKLSLPTRICDTSTFSGCWGERKGGRGEWENPPLCPTAPNICKIQNCSKRLFLTKYSRQLRSRHFTMAPAQVIIPPFPTFYFQVTKFDPFPYVEREYNSNFRRIIRELRAGGEVVGGGEGKQTSTDGVARVNFTTSGGSLVFSRKRKEHK